MTPPQVSTKPFLVSEYGIDAYDTNADPERNRLSSEGGERTAEQLDIDVEGGDGSGVFILGAPDEEAQAER